jgi:hypothetical protein
MMHMFWVIERHRVGEAVVLKSLVAYVVRDLVTVIRKLRICLDGIHDLEYRVAVFGVEHGEQGVPFGDKVLGCLMYVLSRVRVFRRARKVTLAVPVTGHHPKATASDSHESYSSCEYPHLLPSA